MSLTIEQKKEQDDRTRRDVPNHAERIIAERRKVRMWKIEKMYCTDKEATYPSNYAWMFVENFSGDEDDAIARCWVLRKQVSPGMLNQFRRVCV